MAATDTGDLGTLEFISAEVVGDNYLRVRYSLDTTSATEALTGFLVWHDDEAGSTTPVWVDACDAAMAGGGDDGTPTIYEVLVPAPLATTGATWWETFEEYTLGVAGTLDKGGSIWDGAAATIDIIHLAYDDFESYSIGTAGAMDGGFGWDGDGSKIDA